MENETSKELQELVTKYLDDPKEIGIMALSN